MDKVKKYGLVSLLICVSFILGKYSNPSVTETTSTTSNLHATTETKAVENGVIQESEIRSPDGTVKINRTIDYTKQSESKNSTKLQIGNTSRKETKYLPDYQVTAGYSLREPNEAARYSLGLGMRIFSSVYLGVDTNMDFSEQKVYISVGF